MINLNIYSNNFYDNSSTVSCINEAPESVDYFKIENELQEIKKNLKEGSRECTAVETLQKETRAHNWDAILSSMRDFSVQFSSGTLAALVGNSLSRLFGLLI